MNTTTGGLEIKEMDKMLVFIILFLVVSIGMAAILAMGAIPQIFKSAEKIRETQQLVNQTQIQLHEDEERAKQVKQILNQVKTITMDHHNELQNYIDRQNNTTRKLLDNQNNIIDGLKTAMNQNLNISKEHDIAQKEHDTILVKMSNVTSETLEINKKILRILEEGRK